MKLKFIFLGRKNIDFLDKMVLNYTSRLDKYIKSEFVFIEEKKKIKLVEKILKQIKSRDYVIVLDEKGKLMDSVQYAKLIQDKIIGFSSLIFIVGDAYGFPEIIIKRSNFLMSFSKMIFPHMIARLILVEQTYRAFSILNNHPYHHE